MTLDLRARLRRIVLALAPLPVLLLLSGLMLAAPWRAPSLPKIVEREFFAGMTSAPVDDRALARALADIPGLELVSLERRPAGGFGPLYRELERQRAARQRYQPWDEELRVVFRGPREDHALLGELLDEADALGYGFGMWGTWADQSWRPRLRRPPVPAAVLLSVPLALGLPTLLLLWWQRRRLPAPPVPRMRAGRIAGQAAFAYVAMLALGFLIGGLLLPRSEADVLAYRDSYAPLLLGQDGSPGLVTVLFAVVLVPLAEELLFRAWLVSMLARAMPAWVAIGVGGGVFALVHGVSQPAVVLMLWVHGIVLGTLWWRTRSLLACWAVHAANNGLFLLPWWLEDLG